MVSEVPAPLDAQFGRAERQAPKYVGHSVGAARRKAEADSVDPVRVLSLDGDGLAMHQDHRPDRLNLLVVGGKVVRAAFSETARHLEPGTGVMTLVRGAGDPLGCIRGDRHRADPTEASGVAGSLPVG